MLPVTIREETIEMVDTSEAVGLFRDFLIEQSLPRTEIALLGIRCPYCGKTDRIHELEKPGDLKDCLGPESLSEYEALWDTLSTEGSSPGVCMADKSKGLEVQRHLGIWPWTGNSIHIFSNEK